MQEREVIISKNSTKYWKRDENNTNIDCSKNDYKLFDLDDIDRKIELKEKYMEYLSTKKPFQPDRLFDLTQREKEETYRKYQDYLDKEIEALRSIFEFKK